MSKIKTVKGSYIEDITGQTFNRLTVIELTDKQNNDNRWLLKCQCSCEKHTIVYTSMHHLKSGNTKSCGCLKSEKCAQRNRDNTLDLTNTKIGMLTPIKLLDTPDGKQKRWLCRCDCGNYIEVLLGELRRDNYGDNSRHSTLSCGCMKRSAGEELVAQYLDKHNIKYESEKYFSGCINPKTNGRLRFDFYLPDYNLCIEFDGEQHFKTGKWAWTKEIKAEDIRYRDNLKNQFCADNSINLLRIPYTDYGKLNKNDDYLMRKINEAIS